MFQVEEEHKQYLVLQSDILRTFFTIAFIMQHIKRKEYITNKIAITTMPPDCKQTVSLDIHILVPC
jgi:hypothetical protein